MYSRARFPTGTITGSAEKSLLTLPLLQPMRCSRSRMSTSTSSLGTTSTTTSPFAPVTLNGVSAYSSDLQIVLNRAVAIATIPITALQNSDATVLSKEGLLGGLQTNVAAVGADLSALGTLASGQA